MIQSIQSGHITATCFDRKRSSSAQQRTAENTTPYTPLTHTHTHTHKHTHPHPHTYTLTRPHTHTHTHIPYPRDQHRWSIHLAELSSHGRGRSQRHTVVNTCYLFFSQFAQPFKPSLKVCAHKLTKVSCRSKIVTQIRMALFSMTYTKYTAFHYTTPNRGIFS